jgi:hypothetical protein
MSKSGYLTKSGGNVKTWKKRWFVLSDKDYTLTYFVSDTVQTTLKSSNKIQESVFKGRLQLLTSTKVNLSDKKPNSFEIVTPQRTYYIFGATAAERNEWMEAIKGVTICAPVGC